jgi:integrase
MRAPIVANRVQGALSRLFNFAAERGVIDDSPCTRIKKVAEKGRNRVLTDDEIRLLWEALDLENTKIDIYRISKLALKMILLTGQRPGEVCGMTWAEIDNDFWLIPGERMKNAEPNRVSLCPMALEVIEQAKVYSGDCDYVFRSSYKPQLPMSRHALSRAVSRHWAEMGFETKFTPHDLRRTLRTRLAELGVTDIVAERVLGHKLQGMMAVYNRHAYDTEKRQALSQWEWRLSEIIGVAGPLASNVIPFQRVI